ncbi:aminotransferase class I/II-fold pyridoxal phosphate-dependent enzyme [Chryseobacterium carnipullorum]|uniref:Aminotransferase class I/II-fold pyridoxal phosphate-dependent enzyme n=1 Tax=Chryseobacterium carnipullorum TaxID=1124835 RepID=A0A376DZX2_CHRCU|nr:aminotransferase class I/II-fold pyridoxal phosphate-dependent enzyme [Chryseobacterium carnipullorum]AZA50397.1 aminotransferase class I/II-fold pyridoxal phosphate-dependent enzyme [Chryseobacterium carnipullorum]AZA65269.1 aminotransferase class I/II-fold pyridoxal phosphate-dependent enzyme [Chryseobacterium carnipullorum]STC99125.1 Methionine aminotransferase [Chryseobacterium carnipullorum]
MEKIFGFTHYSFFTEMSELATKHHSFDLSLGLPDFDIDRRLTSFLKEAADHPCHQYEPLAGNPLLIKNIMGYNAKRVNGIKLQENEVTIIPCATFALYTALKSILNQGDEVIIIQPSYYTYGPSVVLNGGTPVYYDLEHDFTINWEKFQNCISEKTKAVIVNSPQNPTGTILTRSDWQQLYELIQHQEIYLISEEIYDTYCYDGLEHYSSFLHPELKNRTFCIFSFGKMFHTSGWKVSYLLASETLTAKFRCHQQYISYSANAPAQYALARYLEVFDPFENRDIMERKRDLFNEMIAFTPLEATKKAEGSVFQIVNFRNVSKTMTDVEFSKWLTVEKKTACLPLSAFYNSRQNSDYIRFSFAKKDDLIIHALEHLQKNL